MAALVLVSSSGTRYHTRGIDIDGNVANFNETEQILVFDDKTIVRPRSMRVGWMYAFRLTTSRNCLDHVCPAPDVLPANSRIGAALLAAAHQH